MGCATTNRADFATLTSGQFGSVRNAVIATAENLTPTTAPTAVQRWMVMGMAEIQGLLLAMLFLLVLVIGSILITAIGGGLVLLLVKIVEKLYGERREGE